MRGGKINYVEFAARHLAMLKKARFIRVSPAAVRESHVHDAQIARKAPNYQADSEQANRRTKQ